MSSHTMCCTVPLCFLHFFFLIRLYSHSHLTFTFTPSYSHSHPLNTECGEVRASRHTYCYVARDVRTNSNRRTAQQDNATTSHTGHYDSVRPGRQALTTAGQRKIGACTANLHMNERLFTPGRLVERLRHSRRSPCEHKWR